ncbi:3-phosphoshikimate 1-carboxyvinyltransferase [Clostridium collagenovorans DSM 3089]|uniref:3-phosphoshikimate 1-carboxyvinyltransferase n=1 Tax=Clostridium collagenovorans DSM 3089 TaxID=1121306 RepID=A0A1M5XIY7_9CLOT|nr:3-phosphoshikimate 1-carboxyvinyltransferase [Clostridium collagenovorans]SHH99835.1 3-phosphoshikimate 1-carboxyvinyltransferase [Clostridium collagenovorans DSM 3089]
MKEIRILPKSLSGKVTIPPSKSMSHRALICSGLSNGKSIIDNVEFSKDIIATSEALRAIGVEIVNISEEFSALQKLSVDGCKFNENIKNKDINSRKCEDKIVIQCNESGSTLRFLIPIAMTLDKALEFIGKGKLVERPLKTYYDIFENQGIKYSTNNGQLPLEVNGSLKAGEYEVKGNISSQFISGLLFTLPLLDGDSKIIITTELESKGYIDLTLSMLNKFSIKIENKDYREFIIKGNQEYKSRNYRVEGDFSQGAFFLVGGLLSGEISVLDLDIKSLQGDKEILDIINKMKGKYIVKDDENNKSVITSKCETKGAVIDASQCPDLVPIVSVLAALSEGETRIIKAERLRIKESDRLKAMCTELNKLGAEVSETEDGLIIKGKKTLKGGRVNSWNDHRIAMALAIASIKCEEEVIIENSTVVDKSYPRFWDDFAKLGGDISEHNMGE